jgi:hypothetical protein
VSVEPVCYYIYYRVAAMHAAAARGAAKSVLRALEQRLGVTGRLLRRQDEPLLWMEVYNNVRDPSRFEATLEALLEAERFASLLAPGSLRHIERFVA